MYDSIFGKKVFSFNHFRFNQLISTVLNLNIYSKQSVRKNMEVHE